MICTQHTLLFVCFFFSFFFLFLIKGLTTENADSVSVALLNFVLRPLLHNRNPPPTTTSTTAPMDQDVLVDKEFPLFSRPPKRFKPTAATTTVAQSFEAKTPHVEKATNLDHDTTTTTTFAALGLAEWVVRTCKELAMHKPTPVQSHCIPKILAGRNVLGVAQTGSGKTAAFALPMLHRLAEYPFGIFALVVTPTRELAFQMAEQFKALGSCLNLRCAVVVGGMDMLSQKQSLTRRPHVVIATPGRIKVLLEDNLDIPPLFSNTKVFMCFFFILLNLSYFLVWFFSTQNPNPK